MPTALEGAGDFSQTTIAGAPATVYDPLTQSPFPGNIIPAQRFNPAAAGLLKYLPLPTYTQLFVQNYQIVTNSKNPTDNFSHPPTIPLHHRYPLQSTFTY